MSDLPKMSESELFELALSGFDGAHDRVDALLLTLDDLQTLFMAEAVPRVWLDNAINHALTRARIIAELMRRDAEAEGAHARNVVPIGGGHV